MFTPTNRAYTNVNTNERFVMYHNDTTGQNYLLNELTGEKITSFVCCAFTGKDYILCNGEKIQLCADEFFQIDKNNLPVKQKLSMQKRYSKFN